MDSAPVSYILQIFNRSLALVFKPPLKYTKIEILVDKKNQAFYGTLDIPNLTQLRFYDPKTADWYNDLAYGMMPRRSDPDSLSGVIGNFEYYSKAETAVRK